MQDYRVAVIGDLDSIVAYRGLGITVAAVETGSDPVPQLQDLIDSGEYAVIYLTETVAERAEAVLDRYRDSFLPALIPIPAATGTTGYGWTNIEAAVRKAVGFDILDSLTDDEERTEQKEQMDAGK